MSNHFKYYGTINYKFASDYGLNLHAAALFGYLYDVYAKPWMDCDSEGYCWLQKSKIKKECPILDFEADTIGRYMKKLEELGLINRKTVDGKKSYYRLTESAKYWDHDYCNSSTDGDPTSDSDDNRGRMLIHSSTDGDPTDNNYQYNKYKDKGKAPLKTERMRTTPTPFERMEGHNDPDFIRVANQYDEAGGSVSKNDAPVFMTFVKTAGRLAEFERGMIKELAKKAKQGDAAYKNFDNFVRGETWAQIGSPDSEPKSFDRCTGAVGCEGTPHDSRGRCWDCMRGIVT